MRKSKFLALLSSIACIFVCFAALTLSASADATFKKVAKNDAPTSITFKYWASSSTTSEYDDATNMYYYHAVPNNDGNTPRLENSGFHGYLPSEADYTADGEYAYMKIIARTNISNVRPSVYMYQYVAESGGSSTAGGEFFAGSAMTADGSWQTVYIKLEKLGYEFKQYHFRPLGTLKGNTISGGVDGKYFDIAAYAFFKTESEALAYDLYSECQAEIVASDAIFVSASGNDANDGLTADTPVATLNKANALVAEYLNIDKIYIMGSFTVSANQTLGVASKPTSILGYNSGSAPQLIFNNVRASLAGDVTIDNIALTLGKNDASLVSKQYNLTIGSGVTGTISGKSVTSAYSATVTGSFTDPTVVTVDTAATLGKLYPAYDSATWNGYLRYDISEDATVSTLFGGHAYNNAAIRANGIIEINAAPGSTVTTLNMNSNQKDVSAAAASDLTYKGLRDFRFNGSVGTLYVAGSGKRAAVAASTGVTLMSFSSTSSVSSFRQSGIENETDVAHVMIFNNNEALHTAYETASDSWTVPNEYCFDVDATGTVEAYMSHLPTSTSDLTCTLGGIKLTSNYTHAVIDAGTANEQVISLASLTNGEYAIVNIAEGDHTVTFRNEPPFTSAVTAKAGYIADASGAADADKTYAFIAGVQLASWIDASDITSIGFYGYETDSTTAKVTLAMNATINSELETSDKKFFAVIYDIPTASTEVVLKPFAVVGGTTYVGSATSYVPATIGADTYYGTETDLEDYFAD